MPPNTRVPGSSHQYTHGYCSENQAVCHVRFAYLEEHGYTAHTPPRYIVLNCARSCGYPDVFDKSTWQLEGCSVPNTRERVGGKEKRKSWSKKVVWGRGGKESKWTLSSVFPVLIQLPIWASSALGLSCSGFTELLASFIYAEDAHRHLWF